MGFLVEGDSAGGTKFLTGFAFSSDKINTLIGIYGILQGDGLGILDIDGLAFAQAAVIGIGDFLRAFLRAQTAGNTLFHVHKSRMLDQLDIKISFFTGDVLHFGKCQ